MISIIIPVYNEDESLAILHGEIINVAQLHQLDVEILFVDDGSKDNSWDKICELSASYANTRGIKFRRNFGKAAALSAGFQAANGDIFITMDADLQDDPMEIPNFLKQLEQGGPATFDKVTQPVHQIKREKVMPFTEVSMACQSTIRLAPRKNQQRTEDKSPRKKDRRDPGITSNCSAGRNRFPSLRTINGNTPGMIGIPVTIIKKAAAVICVVEVSAESNPSITASVAPVAIVKSTS